MITAISAAFVRRILGKRGPEFDSVGERLVFESALGLGALGLLVFALGALQLFYLPTFIGLLLLMAVAGWRELSGVISDFAHGLGRLRKIKWSAENVIAAAILAAIGILAVTRSLAPPIADDWDSLAYHLAIPKLFLKHHGIYYVPFASHSNFPFTWEMLYTLGLAFGSVSLAKLFHFGAGIILVGAVYCAGRRHFSPKTGLLAALIVAGIPLMAWEATTAYVDLATALYSFLVVYSLMNFSDSGDRRWAYVAGISAGLAAGTKMTALVMLPVAVVWILWPKADVKTRPGARIAAIAAGLALLIAAPWYIKSLIYTGNPVYPFFYGLFGGRNWSAEAAEIYRADQLRFGMGRDAASFFALPWTLTFRFARFGDYGARLPIGLFELPLFAGNALAYLASIGPIFLAALPAFAVSILRPGRHRPMLLVAAVLTLAWFVMMQNTRYLLPALAVLAPALAYCAELAKLRKFIFGAAAAVGVFTILLMALFVRPSVPVVLGTESPDNYLSRALDIYRASTFVNNTLPKDAKIALFGETRGFYLDRDYIWAEPGHNALIPFDRMDSDPGRLTNWLRSRGIDYVLVNHSTFPDYHAESAPEYAVLVGRAIENGLEEVYSDPTGRVSVYRILH